MFMKNVSDMRIVMQRVSFSPESGGVWKPKITYASRFKFLCFESNFIFCICFEPLVPATRVCLLTMLAMSTQGPMRLLK